MDSTAFVVDTPDTAYMEGREYLVKFTPYEEEEITKKLKYSKNEENEATGVISWLVPDRYGIAVTLKRGKFSTAGPVALPRAPGERASFSPTPVGARGAQRTRRRNRKSRSRRSRSYRKHRV
jgi:hypothetical protein